MKTMFCNQCCKLHEVGKCEELESDVVQNKAQVNTIIIRRDNQTELDNGTYTDCSECFCKNNDYEEGSSCNLGYDIFLLWLNKDEPKHISTNCKLDYVKDNGKIYKPDLIKIIE